MVSGCPSRIKARPRSASVEPQRCASTISHIESQQKLTPRPLLQQREPDNGEKNRIPLSTIGFLAHCQSASELNTRGLESSADRVCFEGDTWPERNAEFDSSSIA